MGFRDKLHAAQQRNDSLLCVGLDPDPAFVPETDIVPFLWAIIDATADLVCAYKPNLAFFEALSLPGLRALEMVLSHIPTHIPTIGDAKRGDVPNSSAAYARALFDRFGFDAATVNPYGGYDSLLPFLERPDKGVFVWCRSSNPGAADLQDLPVALGSELSGDAPPSVPLYQAVALHVRSWAADRGHRNLGLVMGATFPDQLAAVRALCPDLPILVPGIGPQQGDLQAAVRAGLPAHPGPVLPLTLSLSKGGAEGPALSGVEGPAGLLLINASRSVLYAFRDAGAAPPTRLIERAAQAARAEATRLRDAINAVRADSPSPSSGPP